MRCVDPRLLAAAMFCVVPQIGGCPSSPSSGSSCSSRTASSRVQLVAPLATTRVTSLRPTFRWVSPSTAEARLEVCADRACATVLTSTTTTSSSAAPAVDLPPGTSFWRVSIGAEVSVVWPVRVPHRGASIDSFADGALDLDGDGYDDIVALSGTHLLVYPGGASGPPLRPSTILGPRSSPPLPSELDVAGWSGAFGDFDGDGFTDLAISGYSTVERVYFGDPSGISFVRSIAVAAPEAQTYGASLVGVDDVDGDGFADLIALVPRTATVDGGAYVYSGSAAGPSCAPTATLSAPDGELVFQAGRAGDVNGDGYSDVVLGMAALGTYVPQHFYVHRGSTRGLMTPSTIVAIPTPITVAPAFANGDFDSDGYSDLVVTSPAEHHVFVFRGSADGIPGSPSVTLEGPAGTMTMPSSFGASAAAADFDADGYDDLALGVQQGTPEIWIYPGGASGIDPARHVVIQGTPELPSIGGALTSGDFDGDAISDLALTASGGGYGNQVSTILVLSGSTSGLEPPPGVVLVQPIPDEPYQSGFRFVTN